LKFSFISARLCDYYITPRRLHSSLLEGLMVDEKSLVEIAVTRMALPAPF
jgi:hypothetical protein